MTGMKAFTNEPGYHQRAGWVLDTTRDTPNSGAWYSRNRDDWRVIPAFENSEKPWPIQGDHKSAYPYTRRVGRVLIDKPYVARYKERATVGDRPILWDYIESVHIGPSKGLLYWTPGSPEDRGSAFEKSKAQAYNAIGGAKAQLGAGLAEAKQTLDMVSKIAVQLARAINAARVGNWTNVLRHLELDLRHIFTGKALSERWLELQYGWFPLFSDLHSLANVFIEDLRSKDMVVSGKGFGRWSSVTQTYDWDQTHEEGDCNGRVKTVIIATVDRSDIHGLDRMGLVNPASIAWELVPFSFVIDWFMPIGAVLETWTATLGLIPQGWYASFHDFSVVNIRRQPNGWGDPSETSYQVLDLGHYQHAGYAFSRLSGTTWPDVGIYANVQPFISLTRCGNALALLRQIQR